MTIRVDINSVTKEQTVTNPDQEISKAFMEGSKKDNSEGTAATRVVNGPMSIENGEVKQQDNVVKYDGNQLREDTVKELQVAGYDEVISTLRSEYGRPVLPKDAKPNDVVTINGMDTSVQAAIAAGLLTNDPVTGILKQAATPAEEQTEELEVVETEAFDAKSEDLFSGMVAEFGDVNVSRIIEGTIAKGVIDEASIGAIALDTGANRELLQANVENLQAKFEGQVEKLVGKENYPAFKEWASTRGEATAAMTELVFARNMNGMKSLLETFKATRPINIESLESKGYKIHTDNGIHFVEIEGKTLHLEAARKAGLIGGY